MSVYPLAKKKFISSDGSTAYTAVIFDTFNQCTCPGFKYRQTCTHVKELEKNLQKIKESV